MADLLGYSLAAFTTLEAASHNLHRIRELGNDEALTVGESLDVLAGYAAHVNLYMISALNHHELKLALQEYAQNLDNFVKDHLSAENVLTDLSRRFLNYLSSMRMFTDQSEASMKRKFGGDSERYRNYKAFEGKVYDENFSYRFYYKLRNYVQHLGLPLDRWRRTKDRDGGDSGLQLSLQRRRLLEDRDVWGKVLPEIEALPEDIDITAYLDDVQPLLDQLRHAYHEDDGQRIVHAKEALIALINEIGQGAGGSCFPVLARLGDDRGDERQLSIVNFPLHVLGIFPRVTNPLIG